MSRGVSSGFKVKYPAGAAGGAVTSVNGRGGAVTLTKADVSLPNVLNLDQTNASNLASGTAAPARLGSGSPSSTNWLRGDGVWATVQAISLVTGRTLAITGDLAWTSPSFDGSGNVTAAGTLATVNANTGTFGGAATVPQFSVNGKGLTTSVTAVPIQITESQVTNLITDLAAKAADGSVVHTAGAETITGIKTHTVPTIQAKQGSTPATPSAGNVVGPYIGPDGLPYIENEFGTVLQLSVGDVASALHSNADFETVSAGVPTIWGTFWQQGATFASITTDVVSGAKAASITWAAASGNHLILESDTFTVVPGDTVTCAIYSKETVGSPGLSVQFLSKVSGTPDYFDGSTTQQSGPTQTLTGAYVKYSQSFVVPVGHTVARVGYSFTPAAAEACTIQVDASSSARTGSNAVATLPANSWVKEKCMAATTNNVATLAGGAPSTVDGVSLALNDRVLVWQQTTPAQNGIYYVTTLGTGANGTWARAADAATAAQLAGALVAVSSGTSTPYGGLRFATTFKATDTIGTTAMNWYQDHTDAVPTTITYTSGATTFADFSGSVEPVRSRKIGNMIHVSGSCQRSAGTGFVVGVLATTHRPPSKSIRRMCVVNNAWGTCTVDTSGNLSLTNSSATLVNAQEVAFDFMFSTNQT